MTYFKLLAWSQFLHFVPQITGEGRARAPRTLAPLTGSGGLPGDPLLLLLVCAVFQLAFGQMAQSLGASTSRGVSLCLAGPWWNTEVPPAARKRPLPLAELPGRVCEAAGAVVWPGWSSRPLGCPGFGARPSFRQVLWALLLVRRTTDSGRVQDGEPRPGPAQPARHVGTRASANAGGCPGERVLWLLPWGLRRWQPSREAVPADPVEPAGGAWPLGQVPGVLIAPHQPRVPFHAGNYMGGARVTALQVCLGHASHDRALYRGQNNCPLPQRPVPAPSRAKPRPAVPPRSLPGPVSSVCATSCPPPRTDGSSALGVVAAAQPRGDSPSALGS